MTEPLGHHHVVVLACPCCSNVLLLARNALTTGQPVACEHCGEKVKPLRRPGSGFVPDRWQLVPRQVH